MSHVATAVIDPRNFICTHSRSFYLLVTHIYMYIYYLILTPKTKFARITTIMTKESKLKRNGVLSYHFHSFVFRHLPLSTNISVLYYGNLMRLGTY